MSAFGEISEPSTRTAWEDWDDVLLRETSPQLHMQNNSGPAEITTLLILEGRYLYNFIRAQHGLKHIDSIPEVNLHLYKAKELNYICIIKDYNLVQSSEVIELLKDYIIKSAEVICILTKPLVEYQTAQMVSKDYIIRTLNTTKIMSNKFSNIPHLEQPNMIAGVTAGALGLREILDKPAVAVVCYIENPEDQDISELQTLLQEFIVIPHTGSRVNNFINSNLYI